MSLATFRIEMQFSAGIWTAVPDVVATQPVTWNRGQMIGAGPTDRTAVPGQLEFSLRNDAGNSGGLVGYYSPHHANCRTGFTFGIPVRVIGNNGSDHILWTGKLRSIDPEPGLHRGRRTNCIAQDCIADLVEADVRSISPQVGQTEVALLTAVINALATEAQPTATDFDTALDTYPYAFDDIGGGVKAIGAINDVAVSALGFIYPTGDGTLVYENRHTRSLKASSLTLDLDSTGVGLAAASTLSGLYNRIRVTIHPKTIDSAATTVIFAMLGAPAVAPGDVVEMWGDFRDPTNTLKLIGAINAVAPVASTDYIANSASDGSGVDLTSFITVTATAFAASVKFVVSNSGSQIAYMTTLQIRGKGVYDNAPQTVEAFLAEDYGDRPLDVDLKYLADANVAQDLADYLLATYADRMMVDEVAINGAASAALMTQALTREIGDVVTVSESVTGVSSAQVAILGISAELHPGGILHCLWTVGPQAQTAALVLDDSVRGALDGTTSVLGYA